MLLSLLLLIDLNCQLFQHDRSLVLLVPVVAGHAGASEEFLPVLDSGIVDVVVLYRYVPNSTVLLSGNFLN